MRATGEQGYPQSMPGALLLSLLVSLCWAEPGEQRPSLRGIFEAHFSAAQREGLRAEGREPSLEQFAAAMTTGKDSRRERAQSALEAWAAATEDPVELAEIAKGFRLLGAGDEALLVSARLRSIDPKNPTGYSLAAELLYERKDAKGIEKLAREAAAHGVSDSVFESHWKLLPRGARRPAKDELDAGPVDAPGSDLPFKPEMRIGPVVDPPSAPAPSSRTKIAEGAVPSAAGLLLTAVGLAWWLKGRKLADDAWQEAKQSAAGGAIIETAYLVAP